MHRSSESKGYTILGQRLFFPDKNLFFFNLMPSLTNPMKGSNGPKFTFFARAPNVYGLVLFLQGVP